MSAASVAARQVYADLTTEPAPTWSPPAANDNAELIVDLFAGGGGASTAILLATGRGPDIAINHDKEAIALHQVNHPKTKHFCADVNEVEPRAAVGEFLGADGKPRPVGLMWASPDCKHHSKARGGKPREKNIRSLAWVVVRWAEAVRPRVIALENVEEFQDWGRLLQEDTLIHDSEIPSLAKQAARVNSAGIQLGLFDAPPPKTKGRTAKPGRTRLYKALQPDPRYKGETFKRWVASLEKLGYVVEWRELVAADYGAPTTRKRLFLIARCDGQRIVWPAKTHAPRDKAAMLGLQNWLSAASIIDWSRPVPSIFGRKRPLETKTHARIAKGIERYVIKSPRPFIVPVTHSKGWNTTRDGADPLATMTTAKGGEFAVGAPTIMPVNHAGGEGRVYDPHEPARTITAAPRGEQAVASAFLKPRYGERDGQQPRALDIEGPSPTVVPTGNGADLAGVFMQKMAENGVGSTLPDPLHTAMAGATKHYEVAAFMGRQFGTAVGRDAASPAPTVMADGAGGKTQVVSAHLGRMTKGSIGSDLADPALTGTTKAKDSAVAAYMDQQNGDRVGRPAIEPVTTLTHRSTQQHVAAISIDKYYGTGMGNDAHDPAATVTSRDRMAVNATFLEQANTGVAGHDAREPVSTLLAAGSHQRVIDCSLEGFEGETSPRRADVLAFLWEHFGEPTAAERADPLATAAGRLKFGLVLLDGVVWRIVDIGMRMLTPRELYGAQGFPADYVIDLTFEGKPLTKTAQTRMAGNSVSPPPATALLACNYRDPGLERLAA